jgi:anti-sigma factor RsiW
MTDNSCSRTEFWLMLPWLANGRLSHAERVRLEEHLRDCEPCARELAAQRLVCQALTEPERITYAPGPSFRKLVDRIDGRRPARPSESRPVRTRSSPAAAYAAWRPPGLAWAATFLLLVGFSGLASTAYRWSQPLYVTHTATPAAAPDRGVLHIAFAPSLSISAMEELLRSSGARVVEGPDKTGIFGVSPVAAAPGMVRSGEVDPQLRDLAARLRADPRVRWVEPVAGATSALTPERPREP